MYHYQRARNTDSVFIIVWLTMNEPKGKKLDSLDHGLDELS